MKDPKRFIRVLNESGVVDKTEIWVDNQTGVNYLYHSSGYSGGLTPLLDAQGHVVVTSTNRVYASPEG